jgi:Raf kinase inhibitor-like YbhB/YbcL family protein
MFAPPGVHPWRRLATIVATATLLALAAGCGTSGRDMQAPKPGATAPPRRPDPTTTTTGPAFNVAPTSPLFTLGSPGFTPGGDIPAEFTCDGAGTSPPFDWANAPAGTVELDLVMTDPDAGGFVHWMIAHIAPTKTTLSAGSAPAGSVVLANTNGAAAYAPLCPPSGETHTYDATLYALDTPSGLTAQSDTTDALTQLATTAVGTAVLTGSYTRNTAN